MKVYFLFICILESFYEGFNDGIGLMSDMFLFLIDLKYHYFFQCSI